MLQPVLIRCRRRILPFALVERQIDLANKRAELDFRRCLIPSRVDRLQNLGQSLLSFPLSCCPYRPQRDLALLPMEIPILGDPITFHVFYFRFPVPLSTHEHASCPSPKMRPPTCR